MGRRIDIELTSRRDDGIWTWRVPGARQPRGEVDGALVPDGSKVGDVLRADADFDLDGIVVTSVVGAKAVKTADARRAGLIEMIGSGSSAPTGVSVTMAGGGRRRRDEGRRDDGERADRPPRGERTSRGERGPAAERPSRGERPAASADRERPGRDRRPRPERAERAENGDRPRRGPDSSERAARQRRMQPAATFRNAALAELRPEQLPVAEQLLRGGIPAVRQAIEEQNARASSEGRATVSPEPLLAMAEELLPKMTLASWKDRATALRAQGKEAPLREVRSVVAGASAVALDDEARALHGALRESLATRVTALRDGWHARITAALDEGRVEDALRVASRPPEPAARIPAEMAVRMAAAAGAAMAPDVPEAQWTALLQAVVASPVRRSVKPAGLPTGASEELLQVARHTAGQVPELARLLGLPIPPPPGPRRAAPPRSGPGSGRSGQPGRVAARPA